MKKLLVILTILLLFIVQGASAEEKTIQWKNYKEGMALSKKTNKNVYIFFHTSWCSYCTKMKNTTFKNKEVVEYLNSNFIPIGVDGDKEKDITKKYRVRAYPASIFLADGKTSLIMGFVPQKKFIMIIKYITTKSYLKMPFSKFIKQNG